MEAIGLALGVAPLIVGILQHHPGPINALKAAKRENANEMLLEFYTDLQYEVSMLELTLTELVKDLPISSELKDKLIDKRSLDSKVWKTPPEGLQESLHNKLQPCAEPFKQSMEKILRLLAKLVDDRDLLPFLAADQTRVCAETPYAKLEIFLDAQLSTRKRLRLGWKKTERDDIIKNITKHNKKLNVMVMRTAKAQASQIFIQPSYASESIPHPGLRQRMNELRNMFEHAYCTCEDKHEIRFGLSRIIKKCDCVKMDIIINMSKKSGVWNWAESKINIHLKDPQSSSAVDMMPANRDFQQYRRSSSSFSGTIMGGSPADYTLSESPLRTTRNTSVSETSVVEHHEGMRCPGCTRHLGRRHENVPSNDICTVVQQGQRVKKASQLVFCQEKLWHNGTTTDTEVPRLDPGESLEAYLQRRSMNMKERKILQVLLAQSVLYFPWTGQNLNKGSIAFHQDVGKPFASLSLRRSTQPTQGIPAPLENESGAPIYRPYNNEILAGLGTTLLEIELGRRIEELQNNEDMTDGVESQFDTNFWTLTRVLPGLEFDMYKGIYGAISACAKCDFDDGPSRFDNPKFLQNVYDRIVVPLERELWQGFSYRVPYVEDTGARDGGGTASLDLVQKWTMSAQHRQSGLRKSVKIAENLLLKIPEGSGAEGATA